MPDTLPTSSMLPFEHSGPWTEADFMALPEGTRAELLDGTLVTSPSGRFKNQFLAPAVWQELRVARRPGWRVVSEFAVRVGTDRIFIPDVSVVRDSVGMDDLIVDAADVGLVVEIASPSTLLIDRHVKTRAYAEAGIARLLRVEWVPEGPVGELLVLDGGRYRCAQLAQPGETLRVDHPFPADLDLATLLVDA